MNEILWDLTALCSHRPNGWSRPDVDAALHQLGHPKPPEARSILVSLGHMELFDGNRYRVLGPYLVRTIDDELVICGARSEETVDWIEGETGQRPTTERLPCGLDRLTITEEAARHIESVIGPVPEGKLGLALLEAEQNQAEWVGELLWTQAGAGVNPYNPPQEILVKVFDFGGLHFRKHLASAIRDGYAHVATKHPMSLFDIPQQQIESKGLLTRPPTTRKPRKQATLHTLVDQRRGRYYVCENNDRFVFDYSPDEGGLKHPRYMFPPPGLELALHMMHCRQPQGESVRTDSSRDSDYSVYKGIPKDVAEDVVSKLWTGDLDG